MNRMRQELLMKRVGTAENAETQDRIPVENIGISPRVFREICAEAEKYHVAKIVLFGSRARGTYRAKSDLDLAVYDCGDFTGFSFAMQEEVWTLLKMDLIDMNEAVSTELKSEIERDGVVLYEKI